uniref:AlNc14C4G649 protein n=1 Tax=Albugo laibachii Nc14 TaxID=890382 RepID=F0W0K8_9STRA|nr:AlNc14C4G649 [Albugo laibachii Nc14]|eukprot:CCA14580.1 AlNc14C4G649 [Albugo laibachii Nc14]
MTQNHVVSAEGEKPERESPTTCAQRGMSEVSVQGAEGVFCTADEPCSGVVDRITRFACPSQGDLDQSGLHILEHGSCCATLLNGVIGCVVMNSSDAEEQCLPTPTWYKPPTSLLSSMSSNSQNDADTETSVRRKASSRLNDDSDGLLQQSESNAMKTGTGLTTTWIVLIAVMPCVAIAVIIGAVAFRRKKKTPDQGEKVDLEASGADDTSTYTTMPITPKEEVHLL